MSASEKKKPWSDPVRRQSRDIRVRLFDEERQGLKILAQSILNCKSLSAAARGAINFAAEVALDIAAGYKLAATRGDEVKTYDHHIGGAALGRGLINAKRI